MDTLVPMAARLVGALEQMYAKKWNFLALFVLAFAVSVFALAQLDLLPEAPRAAPVVATAVATTPVVAPVQSELPVKIQIPTIALSAIIANPDTTDIPTLDKLLLAGAEPPIGKTPLVSCPGARATTGFVTAGVVVVAGVEVGVSLPPNDIVVEAVGTTERPGAGAGLNI